MLTLKTVTAATKHEVVIQRWLLEEGFCRLNAVSACDRLVANPGTSAVFGGIPIAHPIAIKLPSIVYIVTSTKHYSYFTRILYTVSQKTRHYTPVRNFAKC